MAKISFTIAASMTRRTEVLEYFRREAVDYLESLEQEIAEEIDAEQGKIELANEIIKSLLADQARLSGSD